MDINKPNMLRFRVEFAKAVKSLEEEFEIKISLGTITMRGSEFSARLTGENVTLSESGLALQEESQFTLNAWLVGGDIDNFYGKTYKQGNSSVTVVARRAEIQHAKFLRISCVIDVYESHAALSY